jgi:hypothetical protein
VLYCTPALHANNYSIAAPPTLLSSARYQRPLHSHHFSTTPTLAKLSHQSPSPAPPAISLKSKIPTRPALATQAI